MKESEIKKALHNWREIVKKYQAPDQKKALFQLLTSFLPFLGLWVLMYFSLDWHYGITLGLAMINAFFLVRIFIIQHDCGHRSFLKSRKWNLGIGYACSFFSSIPFKYWAQLHNVHHAHTGQLEYRDMGDIKFLTTAEFRRRSFLGRLAYRLFRSPPVLFGVVPLSYIAIANRIPLKLKGFKKLWTSQFLNNLLLALVYGLLAFFLGWQKFLLVHIPVLFIFSVIAFWFFYVQHQHEENYKQWKDNWDFLPAAVIGSTYYRLPRLFHWLTGNIGFHHIHHLSSRIPNYRLRDCARENPVLNQHVTSMSFRESLKYINHKLWDEDKQRMISFREFYQNGTGKTEEPKNRGI